MSKRKLKPLRPAKPADIYQDVSLHPREWVWCLQCQRCYQAGEYRQVGGEQVCPYRDCGGSTVGDAIAWAQRRVFHPEFPVVPQRDTVYPSGQ